MQKLTPVVISLAASLTFTQGAFAYDAVIAPSATTGTLDRLASGKDPSRAIMAQTVAANQCPSDSASGMVIEARRTGATRILRTRRSPKSYPR